MIIVNIAMKQDDIIKLLENNGYSFFKKQGLKLYFETPTGDLEADAKAAKKIIKESEFGSALFFTVEVA